MRVQLSAFVSFVSHMNERSIDNHHASSAASFFKDRRDLVGMRHIHRERSEIVGKGSRKIKVLVTNSQDSMTINCSVILLSFYPPLYRIKIVVCDLWCRIRSTIAKNSTYVLVRIPFYLPDRDHSLGYIPHSFHFLSVT